MKNYRPTLHALFTVFIISAFQYDAGAQSKWSGSITLTEKLVWEGGKSDRHVEVSFTNALPTLHRDDPTTDLNFTDDKGTGTASLHSEMIIAGKLIGTTDCRGSGQTELHEVVIDPEDSSVYIHAIGPGCSGTTVELLPGGKTEPFGPEFTDITVSTKAPGGVNQTVFTGTETTVKDVVGMGKVTTTITWSLWRGPIDAVLIVSPVNYDNWMPEATADELRKGNVMDINLKVQKRNGGDSPFRVSRFELKLESTSKEKGTTLNYPLAPQANQLPDLRFLPHPLAESIKEDQTIEISSPDGKTGAAIIGSYDGGGSAILTVVAVLEGGIRIEGKLFTPTGEREIRLPKRKANSKIAEAWLAKYQNPVDTADHETFTGNVHKGDGLSAYEEYRGVIGFEHDGTGLIQGPKFFRLDPKKKEVGVQLKAAEISIFAEGIYLFERATGVQPVLFSEVEIGADRQLNKNASYANVFKQYVLKLENGTLPGLAVGVNEPRRITRSIPRQSERIIIDVTKIRENYEHDTAAARAGNEHVPYTAAEKLANTVAHEMGHGINLIHHGDVPGPPNRQAPKCEPNPCNVVYRIYDHHNNEIPERPIDLEDAGAVGSEESGDLSCIMAYTGLFQWAYRVGSQGELIYHYVTFQPVGQKLCTRADGTGINRNQQYFGNATVGNCVSQIKLKD